MENVDPTPFRHSRGPARVLCGLLVADGLLWLSERLQWFSFQQHKGWTALVALGIVVASLLAMILWLPLSLLFWRRFQFSLRFLLLLPIVVALPCAWLAAEIKPLRDHDAIVAAIRRDGGEVSYDFDQLPAYHGITWALVPKPPVESLPWPVFPGGGQPDWLRCVLNQDPAEHVTYVYFSGQRQVTRSAAQSLMRWSNLSGLIFFRTKIAAKDLTCLQRMSKLQHLNFTGTSITVEGLTNLRHLTGLRYLNIDCPLGDAGIESLQDLTEMENLLLSDCRITDEQLKNLDRMTKLQQVFLQSNLISGDGLQHLHDMRDLRELRLDNNPLRDSGLRHLRGLDRLELLALSCTDIRGEGLAYLEQLPALDELSLGASAHDSKPALQVGALKYLGRLVQLTKLSILSVDIEDSDLTPLFALKNLRHLSLLGSHVTKRGEAALKKALPNCIIQRN